MSWAKAPVGLYRLCPRPLTRNPHPSRFLPRKKNTFKTLNPGQNSEARGWRGRTDHWTIFMTQKRKRERARKWPKMAEKGWKEAVVRACWRPWWGKLLLSANLVEKNGPTKRNDTTTRGSWNVFPTGKFFPSHCCSMLKKFPMVEPTGQLRGKVREGWC